MKGDIWPYKTVYFRFYHGVVRRALQLNKSSKNTVNMGQFTPQIVSYGQWTALGQRGLRPEPKNVIKDTILDDLSNPLNHTSAFAR